MNLRYWPDEKTYWAAVKASSNEINRSWNKIYKLMEQKNYYPLRTREFDSDRTLNGIVANIDGKDVAVAELVISDLAQQLVDAYNEKYGCTDKVSACTGGRMCCQSKISHHAWMEQEPGVMDMEMQKILFEHKNMIEEGRSPTESVTAYRTRLHESFSKVNDYLLGRFFYPPNSAHSFTEGADPHTTDENIGKRVAEVYSKVKLGKEASIEQQIEWVKDMERPFNPPIASLIAENLLAIQLWRNGPVMKDVDCEKVIEDLVTALNLVTYDDNGKRKIGIKGDEEVNEIIPAIQNAETALGMLKAFKEQRKITATDVVDAHHAGKDIFNPETFKLPKINMDSPYFHAGMNFRKKEDDEKIKELIAFSEDKIGIKIQWNDQHRIWQQILPERGHIGVELKSTGKSFEVPLVDGRPQRIPTKFITMQERAELVKEITDKIEPYIRSGSSQIAQAIVYAIEEYKSKSS